MRAQQRDGGRDDDDDRGDNNRKRWRTGVREGKRPRVAGVSNTYYHEQDESNCTLGTQWNPIEID